ISIRKDRPICFSCAYIILYRFFGKNSQVGIQWLAHAWKKDDKTKQAILRIAEKINSLIS
ncbi:MAG: hypothetical protein KGD60_14875, partial [Candidatus Thorarchaeota archaeon]|nr:hypothetical protein [Candidatus Thorarchaeota archaeon]